MSSRAFWVGLLGGIVAAVLIGLFAVPALGMFEMTATGEPGFLDWWGDTNWHSSLQWRAPEAELPESADAMKGLEHYAATCLHCHGAPNVSRAQWAHHMQPMPPKLWHKETQQFSDGELFHIISKGVRMTGMPAFGPKHSEEEIWNLVALVRQLDELSDEQKTRLEEAAPDTRHRHGSGKGHDHRHQGAAAAGDENQQARREEKGHRHKADAEQQQQKKKKDHHHDGEGGKGHHHDDEGEEQKHSP